MTAQVWDKAPISYWDHYLDDRETHVYSIGIDGGEPQAHHAAAPASALDVAEPDATSYDIAPDGTEIAFAADSDRSGIDPNFDIYRDAGRRRRRPRNITTDNPARRQRAAVQPRRSAARVSAPDDQGLLRRPRAPDAVRSARRQGAQPDRGLGSLGRRPGVVARLGRRCSARSTTPARGASTASTSPAARRSAVTREHSFSSLAVAGSGPVIVGLRQSFTEPPTLVSIIARTGARPSCPTSTTPRSPNLTQGTRRKRHLQGRERRRRADVGRVSAELHARSQMAAVPAAARRPAQRR